MPSVSVVIPAYRPDGFDALRASMAVNTDTDAEWIVVDDGSGPAYDPVFEGLADTDVRVLRLPENRRQGAARNAGLAEAGGAWVKFLDADDRLDPEHLSALLRAARGAASGGIPFAPTKHVFVDGRASPNDTWRDIAAEPEAQLARLLARPFLHHCGVLFPKELLTKLGGYDETLTTDEDGDLLIRMLQTGTHFIAVPEVNYLYVHAERGGRVSSDNDVRKLEARLRVCDKVEESYAAQGTEMPPGIRRALAQRLDKIAMSYWAVDRAQSKAALNRASRLDPGYVPDARWPLRTLRRVGGPSAALAASGVYRRLRNRPAGGTQG
ncbi:glycosyltransferase family 2 protein [Pseudoruegeria sp. HB172150]|uniref:glycosyltransferase family 2 protein n=1 Tax=Pseudoruegeria sp. HB172150 TaxID=2721164 RepID=UPI001556E038|nr:glycosyltransferase family 2 protein [Pseudoruegeria sp. HB172150]